MLCDDLVGVKFLFRSLRSNGAYGFTLMINISHDSSSKINKIGSVVPVKMIEITLSHTYI